MEAAVSVPLDAVDRELARLWAATARTIAHTSLNLVAFCATPDELPRARGPSNSLGATHPCRT